MTAKTLEKTDTRAKAEAIERDVRRTQDEMGETIDRIEDKLNPREVTRSALGDEGTDFAREALDVAKQNPIPVALIATGAVWLLATSRSPTISRLRERITGKPSRSGGKQSGLRPRSAEPAPIGPPGDRGEAFDRRAG